MQTPASLRGWGWGAEEGKSIEPKTWQLAWAIQGKHAKKKNLLWHLILLKDIFWDNWSYEEKYKRYFYYKSIFRVNILPIQFHEYSDKNLCSHHHLRHKTLQIQLMPNSSRLQEAQS